MSDYFEEKDYGEYFSLIEQRIKKEEEGEVLPLEKPRYAEVTTPIAEAKNIKAAKKRGRFAVLRIKPSIGLAVFGAVAAGIAVLLIFGGKGTKVNTVPQQETRANAASKKPMEEPLVYPYITALTAQVPDTIFSKHVTFVSCEDMAIIAERGSDERCYPASTTKIMTALVAAENAKNLDDTYTITYEITDPLFKDGATVVGFSAGETVTVKDMIYGAVLPSGGDAAIGLANKIAGSEKDFVVLMNKKAEELGLSDTHFTNCTGLFDKDHYSTANDLAVIMKAALENDLCRTVLSSLYYTTTETKQHPNGITVQSTLFSYMYGNEAENAVITAGKTGYVNESGYCFVTLGSTKDGREFICVTLGGGQKWPSVFDQINMYKAFAK